MTTKLLVLYMAALMPFQTCWSVLVQPSTFTLPHIPWLSGVAVAQANPPTNLAGGCLATGTASGTPVGSVVVWQPSMRTTTPIAPGTGYLIADLFLDPCSAGAPAGWCGRKPAACYGRGSEVGCQASGPAAPAGLERRRGWVKLWCGSE